MDPADIQFVVKQLSKLPHDKQQYASDAYTRVYNEDLESEPVPHKKNGAARKAANERLLAYVKKITELNNER